VPEHHVYETLRDALRAEEPVALATVTEGPNLGAKLLGPSRRRVHRFARRSRSRSGRGS